MQSYIFNNKVRQSSSEQERIDQCWCFYHPMLGEVTLMHLATVSNVGWTSWLVFIHVVSVNQWLKSLKQQLSNGKNWKKERNTVLTEQVIDNYCKQVIFSSIFIFFHSMFCTFFRTRLNKLSRHIWFKVAISLINLLHLITLEFSSFEFILYY